MKIEALYQEKLTSKWITIIFLFFALLFLFFIIYQAFIGPLGNNPAPNWALAIMFLIFLFLTVNFLRLTIQITPQHLVAGYGIFKHKISWDNVESVYPDKSPVLTNYGGWGIRFGKVGGKWRLVYNIPESDRIVMSLKDGKFREFVFSTKNSQEVITLIKEQIDKM